MNIKKLNRGFTLIELLVVIAIIGVLATLLLLNLTTANAKKRDLQRSTGVVQIRSAVEQYFDDNGSYPIDITVANIGKYFANQTNVPMDPLSTPASPKPYGYAVSGLKYQIYAQMENTGGALRSDSDIDGTSFGGKLGSTEAGTSGKCTNGGFDCLFDVGQN